MTAPGPPGAPRAPGPGSGGRPAWRELLRLAERRLGSATEARRLVERASGYEGGEFIIGLDMAASERTETFFRGMLERRAAGEPLQYVLGCWGFRTLDLYIDRRVLIPRPETEVVVEVALAELARLDAARPTVVDLGTGSGAIALAIAAESPRATVWATDRSPDAVAVARANLTGIGTLAATRVTIVEGDWFAPLPPGMRGGVDLVVANPPYVADGEELPDEVAAWEPAEALRSGPTGLEAIDRIVAEAPAWLARPGVLVVEIAPHQAADAARLAWKAGFVEVRVEPDLTGRDRILVARA